MIVAILKKVKGRLGRIFTEKTASVVIVLIPLLALIRLLLGPTMAFGDLPLIIPGVSSSNFQYAWGNENFGTTVRQGLYSVRDLLFEAISPNTHMFYILSFLLPILLIMPTYYLMLKKLGIANRYVRLTASLLALVNPIVFGDFSKAQTFWVYITLPWIIYFIINIFYHFSTSLKNFVGLAIALFLSFGFLPPLILPIIVIDGLVAASLLIFKLRTDSINLKQIGKLTAGLGLSAMLFAIMALPYTLIAPSGQAAFTPASLLGDYYHNYASTHLNNAFRLSGNDGNGMTLMGYNKASLTNLFGYVFILVSIASLRVKTKSRFKLLQISLLLPLLFILGLFQVLSTNTDLGTKLFQSQFIVSTIRDPAKITEVILPLFVFLFACGLAAITRDAKEQRRRTLILAGAGTSVLIYGWPIFTGNLGLFINRSQTLKDYAADTTVGDIVKQEMSNAKRAIIVPSTHKDELNYQSVSRSLNTLRLGGSLPNTGSLVNELQRDMDNQSPYVKNILDIAGISSIYLKKDDSLYQKYAFGLITAPTGNYKTSSPYFAQILKESTDKSTYTKYENESANSLVSSPSKLSTVPVSADIHSILPLIKGGDTVLQQPKGQSISNVSVAKYGITDQLHNGQKIENGYAQLYSPEILHFRYSLEKDGSKYIFKLLRLNPISDSESVEYTQQLNESYTQLLVDNDIYPLSESPQSLSIRAGTHKLAFGTQNSSPQTHDDLSFDSNTYVGDASRGREGTPAIKARLNTTDKVQGKSSLDISTSNHLALISRSITTNKNQKIYKITFDYKKGAGSGLSYGLYDGQKALTPRSTVNGTDTEWSTQTIYYRNSERLDSIQLNIYLDITNLGTAQTLLDNITVSDVNTSDSSQISTAQYMPDYQLNNFTYTSSKASTVNLVPGGSFEKKSEIGEVGDATSTAPGKPAFAASLTNAASVGGHSLGLASKNHTIYVRKPMSSFDVNKIYKLSFDYKHVKGALPSFTIWQDGINQALAYQGLQASSGWQSYSRTFIPSAGTTNISLYLYSPSFGKETSNLFDNVRIVEIPPIENYTYKEASTSTSSQNIISSYSRISPTDIEASMKDGSGMLVFNESYHKGWKAFAVPDSYTKQSLFSYLTMRPPGIAIAAESHLLVNGFANGWQIDGSKVPANYKKNGQYKILIEYWPERQYVLSLIASLTLLTVLTLYMIFKFTQARNRRTVE